MVHAFCRARVRSSAAELGIFLLQRIWCRAELRHSGQLVRQSSSAGPSACSSWTSSCKSQAAQYRYVLYVTASTCTKLVHLEQLLLIEESQKEGARDSTKKASTQSSPVQSSLVSISVILSNSGVTVVCSDAYMLDASVRWGSLSKPEQGSRCQNSSNR